jgi:hypothetical protein
VDTAKGEGKKKKKEKLKKRIVDRLKCIHNSKPN